MLVDYDRINPPPQVREMLDRLQKRGPVVQAGDSMRWYVLDRPEEMRDAAVPYNGKSYVLAWTTPDKAMFNRPGMPTWALASAHPSMDQNSGERIVSFRFDNTGGKLFGDLTRNNVHQRLGRPHDQRAQRQ